ncbi:MAG: DMT family transporter [Erysipelotrichaceae bacterium]|nr:DMT family transporter [Erysipelotrichaceae bacterium]
MYHLYTYNSIKRPANVDKIRQKKYNEKKQGGRMEFKKGYILVGIAVLLLSYQPNLMNFLLEKLPLILIAFLRIVVATTALFVIRFTTKKEDKEVHKLTLIKESIILGVILSISTIFFCLGMGEMNRMTRFMSEGMLPIFIIMMASMLFTQERNSMFNLVGSMVVIFAIMGVYLITVNDFELPAAYDHKLVYVFLGAITWAGYLIYYRKQEENLNIKDTFLVVGIFLTLFYLIVMIKGNYLDMVKTVEANMFFMILLLALIVDVGFIFTFYRGVEIIGCNRAGIVLMLCPVLTTVTLAMLANKEVQKIQWIGCGLVILANIIQVSKDLIDEEGTIYY